MAIIKATRISSLSKDELLPIISQLMEEKEELRGRLFDAGIDPDNEEDMNRFISIERPKFCTTDDKEQTRIKARTFARDAIYSAVEVAELTTLTTDQAEWFRDMDLLIGLN